jgi:hypothetical protein
MKRIYPILFFLSFVFQLSAQDTIQLNNPSFEDLPRHSRAPRGWFDCGFPGESPPDVQPSGTFNVTRPAYDGKTYLAMVTRDDNTWESVNQWLDTDLEAGSCYVMSLMLCRSEFYLSLSRSTEEQVNYSTPIQVRIWGGKSQCDKMQLLAHTGPIESYEWQETIFPFYAEDNYSNILIEAYYAEGSLLPYNGNVLIDRASAIEKINCEDLNYQQPSVFYDNSAAVSYFAATEKPEETSEAKKGFQVLTKFELEKIITTEVSGLAFKDNGDLDLLASKTALTAIKDALDKASNKRLIVVLSEKDNPNFRNQFYSLQEACATLGFSKKRYKIRAYKKSDKNTAWLWEDKALSLFLTIE